MTAHTALVSCLVIHPVTICPLRPQSTGDFQSGVVALPNELAACQVTPGSEWLLAKIIEHDRKTGMFHLSDEDFESNKGKLDR
jgi:hypothetical protein